MRRDEMVDRHAEKEPGLLALLRDADRQLTICNACRYCEGYCAVFPALERRLLLDLADIPYLANLCHDCRACYQACMFTPPHEFGINIPAAMSAVRVATYQRHARPRWLAPILRNPIWASAGAAVFGIVVWLVVVLVGAGGRWLVARGGPGSFYAIVPWLAMLVPALAATAFIAFVLAAGMISFWREVHGPVRDGLRVRHWLGAAGDVVTLRYLDGGGESCTYPDAMVSSPARRVLHQLAAYGFTATFLSTCAAAFQQDVLGQEPPYPILGVPVLLGLVGGVALAVGCSGLLALKVRAPRALADAGALALDYAFLVVLDLVSISGLLLLGLRATPAMGPMLVLHLGLLVALYLTFPYGKFVHGVYRYAALVKNRLEGEATARG